MAFVGETLVQLFCNWEEQSWRGCVLSAVWKTRLVSCSLLALNFRFFPFAKSWNQLHRQLKKQCENKSTQFDLTSKWAVNMYWSSQTIYFSTQWHLKKKPFLQPWFIDSTFPVWSYIYLYIVATICFLETCSMLQPRFVGEHRKAPGTGLSKLLSTKLGQK